MTESAQGPLGNGVVVFAGPTISASEVVKIVPGARVLAPVAQGDVLAAERDGARIIAIIDGYFERVPSVWHKEILWAMSSGVHVLGSSSMGALRAAELYSFGMEGVGEIFEAYRDGLFESDEEVAVAHASQEHGYRPLSDALINIRCTLAAAEHAGIVDREEHGTLARCASEIFYPERIYSRVFEEAEKAGVASKTLEALRTFAAEHAIDQKKDDALALLGRVRLLCEGELLPKRVDYAFERTVFFDELLEDVRRRESASEGRSVRDEALWDELRVDPSLYRETLSTAYRLVAAEEEATRTGLSVDSDESLVAAADELRRQRDLLRADDFAAFLDQERMSDGDLEALARGFVSLSAFEDSHRGAALARVKEALRLGGRFGEIATRIERKTKVLATAGIDRPSLADVGLDRNALYRWFFELRCAGAVPRNVSAFAQHVLHVDEEQLVELLLLEYLSEQSRADP